MQAIRPRQTGGPELLVVEEMVTPAPAAGEALVRIEAAGVNYIDVYHLTGLYPTTKPIPIGLEGAGVVEQVGAKVQDLQIGDRVAWGTGSGSYASHVVLPADRLVPVPAGMPTEMAAALMLQGITAHYLSKTVFPLQAGHVALIHAAAGGVGLLLTQLAKRAGAQVIGTVSTESKAQLAKEAGVDHAINYKDQDFVAEVRRITGGRGVDVVYDSVGKTTFDGSLQSLAVRGHVVLFGQSSGVIPAFDLGRLSKGSYTVTRPSLFHYTASRAELLSRAEELLAMTAAGQLQVRIEKRFPLAKAAEAYRALTGRATTGKVLLIP